MSDIASRPDSVPLSVSVDVLIARHGVWRVARVALAALVSQRKPRKRPAARHLPSRLRADIGLPPIVDPPGASHWNVRW